VDAHQFAVRYARGLENYLTNGNSSNVASLTPLPTLLSPPPATTGRPAQTGTGADSIGYDDITALTPRSIPPTSATPSGR